MPHILSSCPAALRYTYHHDQVLYVLATKISGALADIPFVKVLADVHVPIFHADISYDFD